MNKKLYKYKDSDSQFIKDLIRDINKTIKIGQNSFLFILHYKLCEYPLPRTVGDDDWPTQLYLGTCHLIKNNSIFSFNSMFEYENFDIRISHHELVKKTVMNMVNLNINDVGGIANYDIFAGFEEDVVSYSTTSVLPFIKLLLQFGFKIYVRKPLTPEEIQKIDEEMDTEEVRELLRD